MRRLAVVIALLAFAAPAQAQSSFALSVAGGNVLSATSVDAKLTGALAISFHGDPLTGCAAKGLCSYSGVTVWRPGGGSGSPPGALEIEKVRRPGGVAYTAGLVVGLGAPGTAVSTEVRRDVPGRAAGTCADASSTLSVATLPVRAGRVTLSVLGNGSSVLSTRCAGPLDADLAGALPTRVLAIRAALQGQRQVDLQGTRSFAAGGFAGRVRSTLVLHLGRAQSNPSSQNFPPGIRTVRTRTVSESLTMVKTSGVVTARFSGASTPEVCLGLDSCGLLGTESLQPRPTAGQGELFATGPARRPYRDFLAALRLRRRGRSARLILFGSIVWDAGGFSQLSLTQPGGQCRDSAPLGPGAIVLAPRRKLVNVQYESAGLVRVRCPSPRIAAPFGTVASGTIPLDRLAQRQFSVVLRGSRTFSDDGYTGRLGGALSITLRRGRLRTSVFRQPAG